MRAGAELADDAALISDQGEGGAAARAERGSHREEGDRADVLEDRARRGDGRTDDHDGGRRGGKGSNARANRPQRAFDGLQREIEIRPGLGMMRPRCARGRGDRRPPQGRPPGIRTGRKQKMGGKRR